MNVMKSVTKWVGGAAFAAVMFFGLSHKAEAQGVSFGVQIGGPVYVQRPAYPVYGAYGYNNSYYRDDAWRRAEFERQRIERERWERERWERDHRGYDRDRGHDFDHGRDFYRR